MKTITPFGQKDYYFLSYCPLLSSLLPRRAVVFLPIVISSPRRRLSEPEADGQKKKNPQ